MYLNKIEIKNYFSIDNEGVAIENLKSKNEIYLVGENGTGKTILLQAIALSIRGEERIGTVIDVLNQNKKENLVFKAELIEKTDLFAYGVNRLSLKNLEEIDIKTEEVYISLFDNGRNLINPVYWLQMIDLDEKYNKNNIKPEIAKKLINELLDKNIEIIFNGSEVIFNEKGTELSFNQLSDGFKNSITWICDLLARLAFKQPKIKTLSDYKAIVMVDEIDLFLHPKLQFDLIKKLRAKFPKIQWIFTTHSPIVVLGASENSIAYKIYKENGITKCSEPIEIKDFTANSLISSNIWDLQQFYTTEIKQDLILDIDDTYKKIYEVVQSKRKSQAHISNDDLISLIEKEIEKENNDYKINKFEEYENTIQNPVYIEELEHFAIRKIARLVYSKLKNENHPLTKHLWGDSYNVVVGSGEDLNFWYPIGILPNHNTKKLKKGILLYDIARRGKNKKVTGLFISFAFFNNKKSHFYFEKFIEKYYDEEKKQKNYKVEEFDKSPRVGVWLEKSINDYFNFDDKEVNSIYTNLKIMYNDWHHIIEQFINEEGIENIT